MKIDELLNTIFREKIMHLCHVMKLVARSFKILLCMHNILKIFFNFVAKKIE